MSIVSYISKESLIKIYEQVRDQGRCDKRDTHDREAPQKPIEYEGYDSPYPDDEWNSLS